MVKQQTPICDFGWQAVDFSLPGTDGNIYCLADIAGSKATLVMFLCNHCPYVQAVIGNIVEAARILSDHGVGVVAIMPNDVVAYPQDSLENMVHFAARHEFGFPYLIDESQETARAYDALCTPDFFGLNADLTLQYRGRLDDAGHGPDKRKPKSAPIHHELREAMIQITKTGKGPQTQFPSIGCSIKWRS